MPHRSNLRIVAYFDIIGWTAACLQPNEAKRVRVVARHLQERAESRSSDERQKRWDATTSSSEIVHARDARLNFQLSIFSDNVAISATLPHARELALRAAEFCRMMLRHGFLARGGIAIGELTHRENLIFGPALIEAVQLEKVASNPRLLVSDPASNILGADLLIKDGDGKQTLNWLAYGSVPGVIPSHPSKDEIANEISELSDKIRVGLQVATTEKHKRKWRYSRRYFSKMHDIEKRTGRSA